MDAKYLKYYNELKGANLNTSSAESGIAQAKSKIASINIQNSAWSEKGASELVNAAIPQLASAISSLESGISELSKICTKAMNLLGELESLNSICIQYDQIANDEEHKNEKQAAYNKKVSQEKACDSAIDAIKGTSVSTSNDTPVLAASSTQTSQITIDGKTITDLKFQTLANGWQKAIGKYTSTNGLSSDYVLYLPPNYNENKKYTLVTYLPGDSGNSNSNLTQVQQQGISKNIDRNAKEPYAVGYTAESIVICPVNPGTKRYSADKDAAIWLKELTDSVIKTYSVDTSKNVISGGSSGGCSALMMAAYYNDYYTDCISLDGDFSTKNFEKYTMETQGRRLAKVNVYTFNAVDDHEVCPIKETNTMRDASQAEGGFFNVNGVGGKHGAGISSAIGPKSTGLSDIIKRINER